MERDRVITRIKSEFVEMPGLRLTVPQAMKLWGLDRDECQRVINALVSTAFLQRNARGEVVKAGS
jgi:hypothetical protein